MSKLVAGGPARRLLFVALLGLMNAASPASVRAATLHVLDYEARNDPSLPFFAPVCNLALVGEIRDGDSARMQAELQAFLDSPRRVKRELWEFDALCLSSEGGDAREAFKLARVLGELMRVVEAGEVCASACALLFMRGSRRDDVIATHGLVPGRYLHHQGRLAFHAPRLELAGHDGSLFTQADVAAAYDRALRTLGTILYGTEDILDPAVALDPGQRELLADEAYGRSETADSFIPRDLLFKMLLTPPTRLFHVATVREAMHWGIEVYGFPPPRHISEPMLHTACLNVVRVRCERAGRGGRCPWQQELEAQTRSETGFAAYRSYLETAYAGVPQTKFRQAWPAPGHSHPISVWYFSRPFRVDHEVEPQERACIIRAVADRGRLVSLSIQTFNGDPSDTLQLEDDPTVTIDVQGLEINVATRQVSGQETLRPWKMLPSSTRLADLGRNPWTDLESGRVLIPHN